MNMNLALFVPAFNERWEAKVQIAFGQSDAFSDGIYTLQLTVSYM